MWKPIARTDQGLIHTDDNIVGYLSDLTKLCPGVSVLFVFSISRFLFYAFDQPLVFDPDLWSISCTVGFPFCCYSLCTVADLFHVFLALITSTDCYYYYIPWHQHILLFTKDTGQIGHGPKGTPVVRILNVETQRVIKACRSFS